MESPYKKSILTWNFHSKGNLLIKRNKKKQKTKKVNFWMKVQRQENLLRVKLYNERLV